MEGYGRAWKVRDAHLEEERIQITKAAALRVWHVEAKVVDQGGEADLLD